MIIEKNKGRKESFNYAVAVLKLWWYTSKIMKKSFHILFALVALLGIVNCLVLEPALAFQKETVCASDDGCDDCFVCCAMNHQILPSPAIQFLPVNAVSRYIPASFSISLDSPSFSIFHPPLAL